MRETDQPGVRARKTSETELRAIAATLTMSDVIAVANFNGGLIPRGLGLVVAAMRLRGPEPVAVDLAQEVDGQSSGPAEVLGA